MSATASAPAGQETTTTPNAQAAPGAGAQPAQPATAPASEAKTTTEGAPADASLSWDDDATEAKREGTQQQKEEDGKQGQQDGGAKAEQPGDAGELQITLPDGVELDPAALEQFTAVAKELGLSSEQASGLVAFDIKRREAADAAWVAQGKQWQQELAADPDFGGPKLGENMRAANAALRRFGTPQLLSELRTLGMESHPGLVKMLSAIGRAIKEDSSTVGGGSPAPAPLSREEKLKKFYDNSGR